MDEWILEARRFIALGKREYLEKARQACGDAAIREFLRRGEVSERVVNPEAFRPLVEKLRGEKKEREAAVVELLGLRRVAVAGGSRERLDKDSRDIAERICNYAASVSAKHGFRDCEALFAGTLGTGAAKQHKWGEAEVLLGRSVSIYRELADVEPHIYRAYVAGTLNNLGTVLSEERQFPAARKAYEEAAGIYRELAEVEPHIYRPDVAMTLNNLGNVLREERQFPAARKAYGEAGGIYRELAEVEPHIYRPYVATTLNNLGNVLRDERQFPAARKAYEEAAGIYRELAEVEPHIYRPDVAMTLNNLGNVLRDERQFPAARKAYEEALEIRRELGEVEPHIYRPDVAMTLNNLGTALGEERQFPAARKAYEEAAGIYRELAEVEPHIYRPYVATTLNNLGSVLREERQFPAARKACEEAGGIYRDLAEVEPHIYRPDVAMSLNNLGTVLSEERQFPAARKAFEEALEIRRELAAEEPPIYGPDVGMTLNNLGNVLEEMGLAQDAGKASLESVRGAEAGVGDPRSVHLGKGNAVAAYRRIARHFASEGSADRLFRTLGAMREGPVRALGDDPGEGLEAARDALEEAGRRVGQEIRILIPQGLTGDGLLMGVLEVKERSLKWERADEFGKARSALFEQILKVFDKKGRRPYEEGAERIRELGKRAWDALPELVRETLCPEAKHDVLVSGDTYWAAFPWEALWCGGEEKEEGFLGLRRHLARWGPLTAGGLGALGRKAFGKGKRTAAVLCPWNAVLERPLPYSRAEAEEIEERLNGAGYLLIPGGRALVGDQANAEAIKSVLGGNPSLIHYTGHGHIVGNEEVLLLSGAPGEGKYSGLPSHFGREEIIAVRAGIERAGKLLEDGALVVLNSCLTGRTREFGGQREDLAWAFLEEGAGAVIASALPVLDDMGAAFGELLYFDRGGEEDSRGMAWRFAAARGFVERIWRHTKSPYWPAWSLFTYHGNPYARLPHIVHGEAAEQRRGEEGRRGSLFARMAKVMGLRDGAEVERAFEEVRSRLG